MSSSVLVGAPVQAAASRPLSQPWLLASAVFAALGLAITSVAVFDLGLAWTPFRFGVEEWEFGTVTRTMDSLALLTTGLSLLLVAAVVQSVRWARIVLGAVFVLCFVALVGCMVLYALNVPVALKAVPAEATSALVRAVARTSLFGLIYIVYYAWLAWFTWRVQRAGSRGGSQ